MRSTLEIAVQDEHERRKQFVHALPVREALVHSSVTKQNVRHDVMDFRGMVKVDLGTAVGK